MRNEEDWLDVRPPVINDSFPPILGVGFGEGDYTGP